MKSKKLLTAATLMLTATAALAQQHIQQAFDALRKSSAQQEVWSNHSVEKDPDTGQMEGMSDVYDFTITNATTSKKQLISNIRSAFEQDEAAAYRISTGDHGSSENYTALAVGNSNSGGVPIGLMKGSSHIYACFLDPDDSLRRYRYAYALEWVEEGSKIKGRIAKTYATTLKFRQSKSSAAQRTITVKGNTFTVNGTTSGFSIDTSKKPAETWLSEFNTFKQLFLNDPDGAAASSYATQIYKLCKEASSLDDAEKTVVAKEMRKLKNATKDDFLQQLFDMGVERLR